MNELIGNEERVGVLLRTLLAPVQRVLANVKNWNRNQKASQVLSALSPVSTRFDTILWAMDDCVCVCVKCVLSARLCLLRTSIGDQTFIYSRLDHRFLFIFAFLFSIE